MQLATLFRTVGAALLMGACSTSIVGSSGTEADPDGGTEPDADALSPDAAPMDGSSNDGTAAHDQATSDAADAAPSPPYGGYNGPPNPAGELHFFVTETRYPGDLMAAGSGGNGFEGADNLCAAEAKAGYTYGTWRAFISGVYNGVTINAPDRITAAGPWYELNHSYPGFTGPLAWANKAELSVADQPTRNPIGHFATAGAWTATKLGLYAAPACEGPSGNSWESTDINVSGGYGSAGDALDAWSYAGAFHCTFVVFLYCFEQ